MFFCPQCSASHVDLMGHEEPGVYDGVLWWHCMMCGHAWHGWGSVPRRAQIADALVEAFLAGSSACPSPSSPGDGHATGEVSCA